MELELVKDRMQEIYKNITLPYQILFIIMATFLLSLYFSSPYLDKQVPINSNHNQCETVNNKGGSNYYQTGEFNLKNEKICTPSPQWPALPIES